MTSTNGGTYAGQYACDDWVDNLEPTPPSVEYSRRMDLLSTTGGECKRRATCLWKDPNQTFQRHQSRCACPPPCFGQKRLRTLPHHKREIKYRYEGCACPFKKTPFKRPGSEHFWWAFVNCISQSGVLFFLGEKLNRFQLYCFLFVDVSQQNPCNVGGHNGEHLS